MTLTSSPHTSFRQFLPSTRSARRTATIVLALLIGVIVDAFAHGVSAGDKGYIQETFGVRILPFMYLGAKHMVTGYDHLLFLLGVIFYRYRLREIGVDVTLFAIGHSTTLLLGGCQTQKVPNTSPQSSKQSFQAYNAAVDMGAGSHPL